LAVVCRVSITQPFLSPLGSSTGAAIFFARTIAGTSSATAFRFRGGRLCGGVVRPLIVVV
jgi:hypothetical protein